MLETRCCGKKIKSLSGVREIQSKERFAVLNRVVRVGLIEHAVLNNHV